MSLEDLAAELGCTKQAVSNYEAGRLPIKDMLERIINVTNGEVTANDWFRDELQGVGRLPL